MIASATSNCQDITLPGKDGLMWERSVRLLSAIIGRDNEPDVVWAGAGADITRTQGHRGMETNVGPVGPGGHHSSQRRPEKHNM